MSLKQFTDGYIEAALTAEDALRRHGIEVGEAA